MKKLLVILVCFTVLLSTVILASEAGKLLIWTDGTRKPIIENLGKQFTKLYGVPVTVQELSFEDIRDRLGVAGPAGKGPDLIIGAHDWLGQLVVNGLLEPLAFMQEMKGEFVKTAVDAFTYGGKIYGLPYKYCFYELWIGKYLPFMGLNTHPGLILVYLGGARGGVKG